MLNTLYARLIGIWILLLGSLSVAIVWIALMCMEHYQQETLQKLDKDLAHHIVTQETLVRDNQIDRLALSHLFDMLMAVNPSVEIYLLDQTGAILAYSAPPGKVVRQRVDLAPVRDFLSDQIRFPLLGDDPRNFERKKIFSVSEIQENDQLKGYLYVVLGGEMQDNIANLLRGSYIAKITVWGMLFGVLIISLLAMILFASLTQRLRRLNVAVEQYRRQNFVGHPIDLQSNGSGDEIDLLTASFSRMAERINEQILALQETDKLRRELVTSVSHDLRTPLTSLQGYLETLLMKADELSEQQKHEYLEIAHKQSERLGKLIAELFELAKLDNHQVQPVIEQFPLPELVFDIAQRFQLKANQKGVQLNVENELSSPFVEADIGLLERVFQNLIENALRYTPVGGTITLAVGDIAGKVNVRVADTGTGIEPDDLPKVFDWFFRAKQSESPQHERAGLGLAIAKRIVELHGGTLAVSSMPNVGTTFSFDLRPAVFAS